MHEASRVYGDKLISLAEQEAFQRILKEQALQHAQVRNYFWRDDFCMYQVTVFLKLSFSYIMGKFQLFIPAWNIFWDQEMFWISSIATDYFLELYRKTH